MLENKAFCDSDQQAASYEMPQVGDEGLEPTCVSPVNNRVLRITGISASPKIGPNLSLGELTRRLIDRWDEIADGVKAEIAELVKHWSPTQSSTLLALQK
tara:strand:- start:141 stop:440 length:300 start_codon:yes stop_codon:yes gene_type:complete